MLGFRAGDAISSKNLRNRQVTNSNVGRSEREDQLAVMSGGQSERSN